MLLNLSKAKTDARVYGKEKPEDKIVAGQQTADFGCSYLGLVPKSKNCVGSNSI